MDTSGCQSQLYATDNVFVAHPDDLCKTPVLAFWVTFGIMVACKAYVNWLAWKFWFHRKRLTTKSKSVEYRKRLPIIPTLSAIVTALYLVLMILVGTNVANASNGGATALYSIMFSIWGVSGLLLVRKLVRLGRRLIPLARTPTGMLAFSSSSSSLGVDVLENRLRFLDKFDLFMSLLVTIQITLLFGASIIACWGLRDPTGVWYRIAIGLIGCFGGLLALILVYHLDRIVHAGRYFIASLDSSHHHGCDEIRKVEKLIQSMRFSQIFWLCMGTLMAIPHILMAAGTLKAHWYVITLMLVIESTCSTYTFLASRPKSNSTGSGSPRAPLVAVEVLPGNPAD